MKHILALILAVLLLLGATGCNKQPDGSNESALSSDGSSLQSGEPDSSNDNHNLSDIDPDLVNGDSDAADGGSKSVNGGVDSMNGGSGSSDDGSGVMSGNSDSVNGTPNSPDGNANPSISGNNSPGGNSNSSNGDSASGKSTVAPISNSTPKPNDSSPKSGVLIYEIYTSGGYISSKSAYAPYKNNYVVLYNANDQPVNLKGWMLLFCSPKNAQILSKYSCSLSGTIQPKSFYVIQGGQAPDAPKQLAGNPLPFHVDLETKFSIERKAGIIALCNKNKTDRILADDTDVVDYLGYGKATSQFKGSGPATGISVKKVLRRKSFTNTNDNASDFETKNIVNNPSDIIYYSPGMTS